MRNIREKVEVTKDYEINEAIALLKELATAMNQSYEMSKEDIAECGVAAREWVTSDESMMSARRMNENVIKYMDETINNFTPRKKFDFVKIDKLPVKRLQHKLVY